VFLAVIASAGCIDGSAETAISSSAAPSSAPLPTADVSTGSISGKVVDDEVRPLAKARVVIAETQAETQTDQDGRFTFNGLEPGTFGILAQQLGYESAGQKVTVVAGEVAEVKIVLKPVTLDAEPYVAIVPRTALVHVGVTALSSLQNQSVVQSLACDPCRLPVHFEKNPDAILAEGRWNDGPTPVVNAGLNVWYYKDWNGDGLGTSICYWQPSESPYHAEWSEKCVDGAKKIDKMLLFIQPGPVPGLVAVELKVETWTSFFYNTEITESYTSLPPA
jgi:hypothetical protein